MTAVRVDTGEQVWIRPGVLVYDNVWAVGDGAVFAVERERQALVAYEWSTGETRWENALTAYLWPRHVSGDRLLVMWHNLQVVSTHDGQVLWDTDYPEPATGFPRMMGGVANSRSVYVSFTSQASGGDSWALTPSSLAISIRRS